MSLGGIPWALSLAGGVVLAAAPVAVWGGQLAGILGLEVYSGRPAGQDHGKPSLLAASRGRIPEPAHSHRLPGRRALQGLPLQADGVPLDVASASVVIMKGILVLSLTLYIFTGLALAPFYLPEAAKHMLFLCLAAMGLAAVGIIFVVVQRREPFGNSFRFLARRGWLPHFLKEQEGFLEDVDTAMYQFYRQYPARAVLAFSLFSSVGCSIRWRSI